MAELHLPAAQAIPRVVDVIQVQPYTGAATADRVVRSSQMFCDREMCTVRPSELALGRW